MYIPDASKEVLVIQRDDDGVNKSEHAKHSLEPPKGLDSQRGGIMP